MDTQKFAQVMERRDITIEQKWLYLVFFYEHLKGNHSFPIQDLVRNKNVMAPWSKVQRDIYDLERVGLIHTWNDAETWIISINEEV